MTVFALGAHPDDIEFMMSGTLFLLQRAGWDVHYMNVANGCCGTDRLPPDEIVAIRDQESRNAAERLGATHHASLCEDICVFYEDSLIRRVAAVVREVKPDVVMLPALHDYMEDHMNTARIGATAVFCRGMPNYSTEPERDAYAKDVAVYHALPYGLRDAYGHSQAPDMFVDVREVVADKRNMLACHRSQKEWLDASQGLDAYLDTMESMSRDVGRMSGRYMYAEGFWLRNHLGYSSERTNPLQDVLGDLVDVRYDG